MTVVNYNTIITINVCFYCLLGLIIILDKLYKKYGDYFSLLILLNLPNIILIVIRITISIILGYLYSDTFLIYSADEWEPNKAPPKLAEYLRPLPFLKPLHSAADNWHPDNSPYTLAELLKASDAHKSYYPKSSGDLKNYNTGEFYVQSEFVVPRPTICYGKEGSWVFYEGICYVNAEWFFPDKPENYVLNTRYCAISDDYRALPDRYPPFSHSRPLHVGHIDWLSDRSLNSMSNPDCFDPFYQLKCESVISSRIQSIGNLDWVYHILPLDKWNDLVHKLNNQNEAGYVFLEYYSPEKFKILIRNDEWSRMNPYPYTQENFTCPEVFSHVKFVDNEPFICKYKHIKINNSQYNKV